MIERQDWRAAMLASVIANVNRGPDTEPFQPIDFMPFHKKEPAKPTDLLAKIEQLNAVFGGRDERKNRDPKQAAMDAAFAKVFG
jgi:hypothetical protein